MAFQLSSPPISRLLRPRVTLIHPSAGVNQTGGSEVVAIELAQRLRKYFQITLLSGASCGEASHPISAVQRTRAAHWVRHPRFRPLFQRIGHHPEILIEHCSAFLPTVAYLLANPCDVIFPHNDYGGLAAAAVVRAIQRNTILYTEHLSLHADGKCLRRNLKFRPDRLVVLDQETAHYAMNVLPQQSIEVISNGVDLNRFTPEGPIWSSPMSHPTVICTASLNRQGFKRVELAIQAVAKLPYASLLLCGDGLDRAYYQALGDRLLGPDRFLIRQFKNTDMPSVYRSGTVFTLPSLGEPFGLSYLEAMACGLPAVGTDDAMRLQVIGLGGEVCDVENIDLYAQTLHQVLMGADRSARARQNALRYDWDTIAISYQKTILEMLASRPQATRNWVEQIVH